jgi:hypothetical protein
VLAFVLTNIECTAEGTVRFQLPLDILGTSIDHVGAFPFAPGAHIWEGPTLFIEGENSKFVRLAVEHIARVDDEEPADRGAVFPEYAARDARRGPLGSVACLPSSSSPY